MIRGKALTSLLAIASLTVTSTAAQAKDERFNQSGNAFLQQCGPTKTSTANLTCSVYVTGLVDGITVEQINSKKKTICMPDTVIMGQIKDVIIQ